MLQLFESLNLHKTPPAVKKTRKISGLVLYSYLKDGEFIKGCTKLVI